MGLMQQMFSGIPTTAGAPIPPYTADSLFNYVSLLLSGDTVEGTALAVQNNTFLDSSYNNNVLTRVGTPTQGTFSPFSNSGWSGYFNGTTDRLTVPSSPATAFGTNDFTIECWINLTGTLSTYQRIWQFSDDNDNLELTSGALRAGGASQGAMITSPVVSGNVWYHVALVRASGVYKLYINGSSVGSFSNTYNSSNRSLGLMSLATGGNYAAGFMSNFRIVKGTAVYTANFTPSTTPLTTIANTSLLTLQDSRFKDNSTNNLTITPTGTPKIQAVSPFNTATAYSKSANSGSGLFVYPTDYVSTPIAVKSPLDLTTGDWTLEAWVYPLSFSGPQYGCGIICSNTDGIALRALPNASNSTQLNLYLLSSGGTYIGPGASGLTGNKPLYLNQWQHVAATRNGNTYSIYVNGELAGTHTDATAALKTETSFNIGKAGAGSNPYWNGYISNARITKAVVYPSAFTPPAAPLGIQNSTSLLLDTNAGVIDNTGKNVLTTVGDAKTSITQVKYGTASMSFDGTGDRMTIPATPQLGFGTGDFTVEFWINLTQLPASGKYTILDFRNSAGAVPHTVFVQSTGYLGFYNGTADVTSTLNPLTANSWYHVAYSRAAGTLKIFVNGVQSYSAANTINYTASNPLSIGSSVSATELMLGYIDDLRITNGYARYTGNFTPPTAALPDDSTADPYYNYTSLLLQGDLQYSTYYAANNNAINDSSYNAIAVTKYGVTTQGSFSPFSQTGWSGYFDGTGDYLSIASSTAFGFGTSDFTIEYWVYPTRNVGNEVHVDLRTSDAPIPLNIGKSNTGAVRCYDGATIRTGGTMSLNAWNHIAWSRVGSDNTVYLNGSSVISFSNLFDAGTTRPVTVGTNVLTSAENTQGYISNIRIVKGSAVYTGNFTPPTAPLTAIAGTSLLTLQSGRFKDNSTNNLAITLGGTPSIQAASPFNPATSYDPAVNGGSIYFNGTDSRLSTPTNPAYAFGTGDFTIEYWIYPTSFAAQFVLTDFRGASGTVGFTDFVSATTGKVNLIGSATFLTTTNSLRLNEWTHVAYVRSGTTVKVYFNGVADPTTATDSTSFAAPNGLANIGTNYLPSSRFPGYLSDVRITKGTAVYTTNFTPPTAPLAATAATSLLLSGSTGGIIDAASGSSLVTVGNAQISTVQKKYGTASMYFDGTGDSINVAGTNPIFAFGTGDFTIEFWMYANVVGGVLVDFRPEGSNGAYPTIYISSNAVQYMHNSLSRIASTPISANTWYHVAVSRQSSFTRLFINGVEVGSITDATNYFSGANRPIIGTGSYIGYIDDLRITNGVARYTANFTPPTAAFPTE